MSRVPKPKVMLNHMLVLGTGLPYSSRTSTIKGAANSVATVPLWLLPEMIMISKGFPGIPVAVNTTWVMPLPAISAVTVFRPTIVPKVRLACALPLLPVNIGLVMSREPLPNVTLNQTFVLEIGFPY